MNIAKAINKARGRGANDTQILKEIREQNPDKEAFFRKAEERGATSTQILEEIIKQNQEVVRESPSPSPLPQQEKASPRENVPSGEMAQNSSQGEGVFPSSPAEESPSKKESPGEDMRKDFLKRIEAREQEEEMEDGKNAYMPSPSLPNNEMAEGPGFYGKEQPPSKPKGKLGGLWKKLKRK